jgi:hypothetical protein
MKNVLSVLAVGGALVLGGILATGCGQKKAAAPIVTETAPAPAGETKGGAVEPGEAATYTCPMHPEVTSNKPGKCPICAMNLEKKAKTSAAPVQAEKARTSAAPAPAKEIAYICPCTGCGGIRSDKPGTCEKCGMKLVPEKA